MTDMARPADWDGPVEIPEVDTSLERIVVPFDGSKAAERALGYAAAFARYSGGEIIVVVAYDPPITVRRRGGITLEGLRSEMEKEAHDLAEESASLLVDKGLRARAIVVRGDVADAILDTIDEEAADIAILGRSGLTSEVRGGERREWGTGSVTDKIVRNATIPVMVVG
ncbi:MAG TPA: universal stress protein [Acidimicrobiia bacterium]|nr:universal stress protein [Acidimicrobiia bacterium]